MKGNHDTDFYQDALFSPEILLVVLDDANRRFAPEALDFCREALASYGEKADHILFAFHYPPPNPIATNSINPPEWKEFQEIYAPYKKKTCYFIAGHVHALAITECDGITVSDSILMKRIGSVMKYFSWMKRTIPGRKRMGSLRKRCHVQSPGRFGILSCRL